RERETSGQCVCSEPKSHLEAQTALKIAACSDNNRRAQTLERAREPKNDEPFSRGNTPEKVITDANPGPKQPAEPPTASRGDQGASASPGNPDALTLPNSPVATIARNDPDRNNPARGPAVGVLSDAIRNVQRYAKG